MSRPIFLLAKQSLLIIPAKISREKQTASSLLRRLTKVKIQYIFLQVSALTICHSVATVSQFNADDFVLNMENILAIS